MKINKELFELAQIRGTIDSDIEPIIFIDNKKLIFIFVWPSIKVLFIKANFFNRSLVIVCWEGRGFISADSDRFIRLVIVWRCASGFIQTMQVAATL